MNEMQTWRKKKYIKKESNGERVAAKQEEEKKWETKGETGEYIKASGEEENNQKTKDEEMN
jgi:hypothetical protein